MHIIIMPMADAMSMTVSLSDRGGARKADKTTILPVKDDSYVCRVLHVSYPAGTLSYDVVYCLINVTHKYRSCVGKRLKTAHYLAFSNCR
jgi:hypothetical protein